MPRLDAVATYTKIGFPESQAHSSLDKAAVGTRGPHPLPLPTCRTGRFCVLIVTFPVSPLATLFRHHCLLGQLVRRNVLRKYRGSYLGIGRSFLYPLLLSFFLRGKEALANVL